MARPYTVAPNYLRTGQVAELLNVAPKTITRWARAGKLPNIKTLGGHRRYEERAILALLDELTYRPSRDGEVQS